MADRERRVVAPTMQGREKSRPVVKGIGVKPRQGQMRKVRKRRSNGWYISAGIVLVVLLVIGFIVYISSQQSSPQASPADFQALTSVPVSQLASVGTGSANNALNAVQGNHATLLRGATGKPELFYMGGEYCPYCAAQRWAMITALSRFGSFTKAPTAIFSAEDHVPTYTFYKSAYQSQYIDFVAVEAKDNQANPQALQVLSKGQQQLVDTYDAPPYTSAQNAGSIPFLDFGNQYISSGSYYDPTLLIGQSHDEIVQQLAQPSSRITQGMFGAANYITAALCSITNSQPMSVCAANPIPPIEQKLSAHAQSSGHGYGEMGSKAAVFLDQRRARFALRDPEVTAH